MNIGKIVNATLDNGLKVICLKKSGAPIVAAQVWYNVGSSGEKDGIRGISHILEHMMFRGSLNVKSEEHALKINNIGGHCNAGTAEDVTMYLNSVPRDYLKMVFDLEADRMSNLSLDKKLFDTEKKVIIEEYHNYMNMPVTKAFLEFRSTLYEGHSYAVSPLGKIEDIESITVDDCNDYYKRHYAPNNAVLVVVGDFESETQVLEMANDSFGKIELNKSISKNYTVTKPDINFSTNIGTWMERRVDFDVPMIITGYLAPSSSSPDALPLNILQMILSQGETGRLNQEVVRKKARAVMAGGMNHFLKYSGMSIFFAAFTPDISANSVEKSVSEEIDRIINHGILHDELEKIINTTLTTRTLDLYSAENICQKLAYSEIIDGDYNLWVKRLDELDKINNDILVETARKYWTVDKQYKLYLKPLKVKPLLYFAGFLRRIFKIGL